MAKKKFYIYVKEIGTGKIIHKVHVQDSNLYERRIEKVVAGMNRNMDIDRFFVDDAAAQDEALKRAKKKGGDAA